MLSIWGSTFPKPTLDLNFIGASSLDSRVTFTRASTATYFDSAGTLQTAAINAPRFDYNPSTLAARGLLIEEQRTNLLTYSEQFDNAAWTKSNASITADAATSPAGTATADKLIEDTATSSHFVRQNATGVVGTSYTSTVFVKAAERTAGVLVHFDGAVFCGVSINLSTGVLSSPPVDLGVTDALATATVQNCGNGWYRVSVTRTQAVTTTIQTRIVTQNGANGLYTGNGTSGLYVWGAQLEAGAFQTSYIPTVAATVTRSADIASMTGTNFSSWYNQTQGTIFGAVDASFSTTNYPTICNAYTDSSNYIMLNSRGGASPNGRFEVNNGGASQAALNNGSVASSTAYKLVGAYAANDFALSTNNTTASTDASGSIPTVTTLSIGSDRSTTGWLNGHIQRISYYPTRLPNATLQALTA